MLSLFTSLFKSSGYVELSTVAQILDAIAKNFTHDKFIDGQSGQIAFYNAMITEFQSLIAKAQTPAS